MADRDPHLGRFVEAAGQSLGEAQRQLLREETDPSAPTSMAISEVELEVKATFEGERPEEVRLRPISASDARSGGVPAETVSTVRVRYVALAEEDSGEGEGGPERSREAVIEEVRARADVDTLDRALGGLAFTAAFVAAAGSWLVQAKDRRDRVVREVVVPDSKG
jgi:hypothetical protein